MISSVNQLEPLSDLIRKARTGRQLSQKAFGNLFNPPVAQPTIARWERGDLIPNRHHFPTLAALLNFPLEELFQQFAEGPTVDDSVDDPVPDLYVPNKQHVEILSRGAAAWNRWRDKNPEIRPELAGADLAGMNLSGFNLVGSDLRNANLRNTVFVETRLQGADFSGAELKSANLNESKIQGGKFVGTNLAHAYFVSANLKGANFSDANLEDTCLMEANLTKANFSRANLKFTDLRHSLLSDANFQDATLEHCLVYGVSAWRANFKGAKQKSLNICPENISLIEVPNLELAYLASLDPDAIQDKSIRENLKAIQNKLKSALNTSDKDMDDLDDCDEYL